MKISLIQSDIRWCDAAANHRLMGAMIENAPGSDLYILPEMFSSGFVVDPKGVAGEPGPEVEWMLATAVRSGGAVVGSAAIEEGGRYYNRLYFATPEGELLSYDKRHLFSMGGEKDHYTPGAERKIFEYRGVRIMPLVCYDLRFPVWSSAAGDCDLIIYVASWPSARIGAWDALLRARAIENQCYVAGVNRVGTDPYNGYNGHSVVLDYMGNAIAQAAEGQEVVITAMLNMDALNGFRSKFPAWKDADKFELL